MVSAKVKHGVHCFVLIILIVLFQDTTQTEIDVSPFHDYGYASAIFLYLIYSLPLLMLPVVTESALGLLLYNAFEETKLRCDPELMPFICIRVITRGDFPSMVKSNVERNKSICTKAGLSHFVIEVVTEKPIGVATTPQTREVVVPATYRPKNGTVHKGRVCQYVLEDENYTSQDDDWVVQIDEETVLTQSAVYGILNFVSEGKHPIGQGVVNFANLGIVNWLTTLIDCIRVADDWGRMRFELNVFHQPMSGWKGCFTVTQAIVEKKVNYDHGLNLSLSEETCFLMAAMMRGYSFGFVEGEVWEMSPFTTWELIQQRKRWLQGRLAMMRTSKFPHKIKWLTTLISLSMVALPINLMAIPFRYMFPLPGLWLVTAACRYEFAIIFYMYVFGVVKSFNVNKIGLPKSLLYLSGVLIALPVDFALQVPIVILAFCNRSDRYYIVQKEERLYKNGKKF